MEDGCKRRDRLVCLPIWAATLLCVLPALWGCSEHKTETVDITIDPETTPTMRTLNVNTVVSDSGILRYRIITPGWYVYDEAQEPYWRFPDGIHLEKYDDGGKVDATIDADSARYDMRRDIWRLDGYVCIANMDSTLFLTEQLYWDKASRTVYTDSFIHIERPDRIIEGYGFESNDRMTEYRVLRTSGILPADRFKRDSLREEATAPVFDPMAAADEDPEDARRTENAFNGTPTDTLSVRTNMRRPTRGKPRPLVPEPMPKR